MEIPKIIHQTWKNKDIPVQFADSVSSWRNSHPDWQYILWTDDMISDFIMEYFPDFSDVYSAYEVHIQRVDAARYFILYQFGGVYVDLDFHCFKNISPIIEGANCMFGLEHESHTLIHKKQMIISNAIMACKPKAEFMRLICDVLLDPVTSLFEDKNEMILETTGPFMLTKVYEKHGHVASLNLRIIDAKYLYPLSKDEINDDLLMDIKNNIISDKLKEAYALHYYWGSWWKD